MSSIIQVRVDDEIKENVNSPYKPLTEAEILEKLAVSRAHAEQGFYRDADDVVADIRTKIIDFRK